MTTTNQPITTKIKDRQKEIINALLRFRYLTRPHIQTLLNHKHKEKVIEWLNDLTEKQYIFRYYTKEFAAKPSEYCLDKKSIPYLREQGVTDRILKRIYTEKTHTQLFRNHNLLLADVYLSLIALTKKTEATLHFYTKIDLDGMKYLIFPHPDAYFAIEEKNNTIKRYFLDIFDDGLFMKKRVYQYLTYFKKNYWQTHTQKPFPEIILICSSDRTKEHIYKFIKKKLTENIPSFYLSTWQEIRSLGICRQALQKVS